MDSQAPTPEPQASTHTTHPTVFSETLATTKVSERVQEPGQHCGETWGDFHLLKLLGKGGMGEVYLAQQVSLGRQVAVKILSPDLGSNETFLKRFHLEARAVAQLSHPNVIQIFAAGAHQGAHYFAMELVEGSDLAERLKAGMRPNHRQSLDLISQAARGLAAANAKGLVHRDIKPGNMMLANDGVLKVMDFGLVRLQGEQQSLTMTGVIMGTASYLSPEQGQGEPCDIRTDLYALGVVFYELLTGKLPFSGNSLTSVVYQHINMPPKPPKEIDPSIPEDYQAVVLKCLQKNPADRYMDPLQLCTDLDALAHGKPLSIPSGELRKLRRGATIGKMGSFQRERQWRGLSLALVLVVLCLLAAGGFLMWPQLKEHHLVANWLGSTPQRAASAPISPPGFNPSNQPGSEQGTANVMQTGEGSAPAASREQLVGQAQLLSAAAVDSDEAFAQLRELSLKQSEIKEIDALLAQAVSQRQERQARLAAEEARLEAERLAMQRAAQKAAQLANHLHSADAALANGEVERAEEQFRAALALDPDASQANEGLQAVAAWRQRRAHSDSLLRQLNEALAAQNVAGGTELLNQLAAHEATHPGLTAANLALQQLRERLAEEARQAAAEAARAEQERQIAAQQQALAAAMSAAEAALASTPWTLEQEGIARSAIDALAALSTQASHDAGRPDKSALTTLEQRWQQQRAQRQANALLAELDDILSRRATDDLQRVISDASYRQALVLLCADPGLTYLHELATVSVDDAGHLNGATVRIRHGLSVMPERVMLYRYVLSQDPSANAETTERWRISQALPSPSKE